MTHTQKTPHMYGSNIYYVLQPHTSRDGLSTLTGKWHNMAALLSLQIPCTGWFCQDVLNVTSLAHLNPVWETSETYRAIVALSFPCAQSLIFPEFTWHVHCEIGDMLLPTHHIKLLIVILVISIDKGPAALNEKLVSQWWASRLCTLRIRGFIHLSPNTFETAPL